VRARGPLLAITVQVYTPTCMPVQGRHIARMHLPWRCYCFQTWYRNQTAAIVQPTASSTHRRTVRGQLSRAARTVFPISFANLSTLHHLLSFN
jgi:hypothetical protein